jgi:hypothetical protein
MTDQASKNTDRARANDSAIWMPKDVVQKNAVHLKEAPGFAKPNPFVQPQGALPQAPNSAAAPAGSQQKKP